VSQLSDILLVEDDLVVAEVLRRMLIRADYTVRVATDGRQALAALDEELPAILILDLILPGVSGFTILEHIRNHQMTMPIIIITANPLHHYALHHAGISHVLIKPFQIKELLDALNTTMDFSATA
jgi:DNA-binding response OmpR family regulator